MLPLPMTLPAIERRVLACLPGIDPDRAGEVLGVGAQSVVRAYDDGGRARVLKLPLCRVRRGAYAQTVGRILGQRYDRVQAELDLCATYFGPYLVPTRVVVDPRTGCFGVLQDRITVAEVTPEVLARTPHLDTQLGQIMEANRRLIANQGRWLDAMGWNPAKFARFLFRGTPYLENVALDSAAGALRLFDFGLFPVPDRGSRLLSWYYRFLLAVQQRNMRAFGHAFAPAPG